MIVVRRIFAVILAILLIPVLLITLVAFRLTGALTDPDFYIQELRQAHVYDFAYDKVLPAAVDEAMKGVDQQPLGLQLTNDQIVAAVREITPSSWAQQQVEQVIGAVVPYLSGREEDFRITVPLEERASAALVEAKKLLQGQSGNIYTHLANKDIPELVDEQLRTQPELPFGLTPTGKEFGEAFKRKASPEWVRTQTDQIIDKAGPYLTGKTDRFAVIVPLDKLVEVAQEVARNRLRQANLQDFLFQQVITPAVRTNLGTSVALPFGVTLTQQEVTDALKQVATKEWLDRQVDVFIDATIPYLAGQRDSFEATVSLTDRKPLVTRLVAELAERKLVQLLQRLPACSAAQLPGQLEAIRAGRPPLCLPPGISPEALTRQLGVADAVARLVALPLPDSLRYTQADLRRALSPGTLDLLDRVRDTLRKGWVYTETDLRRDLVESERQDVVDRIADVRRRVREGWVYTHTDLREDLQAAEGVAAVKSLDDVRSQLNGARGLRYLGIPILGLLLVGVGFLGGRGWRGRLAWAAGALAGSSLLLYIATGPVYGAVAEGPVHDALLQLRQGQEGAALLAAEKAIEVGEALVQGFVSGVASRALLLFILGLALCVVALAWTRLSGRLRRPRAP